VNADGEIDLRSHQKQLQAEVVETKLAEYATVQLGAIQDKIQDITIDEADDIREDPIGEPLPAPVASPTSGAGATPQSAPTTKRSPGRPSLLRYAGQPADLQKFTTAKATIGEQRYYHILGAHGMEKSNQFATHEAAAAALADMRDEAKRQRTKKLEDALDEGDGAAFWHKDTDCDMRHANAITAAFKKLGMNSEHGAIVVKDALSRGESYERIALGLQAQVALKMEEQAKGEK
jgi:hypothetical protein